MGRKLSAIALRDKPLSMLTGPSREGKWLLGTEEQIQAWIEANGGKDEWIICRPGDRLFSMACFIADEDPIDLGAAA